MHTFLISLHILLNCSQVTLARSSIMPEGPTATLAVTETQR